MSRLWLRQAWTRALEDQAALPVLVVAIVLLSNIVQWVIWHELTDHCGEPIRWEQLADTPTIEPGPAKTLQKGQE